MLVALIGNQNCGKSTLFNALTGLKQKTGNWPGVTIEKKQGLIKNTKHNVVDLPGIYSLNPYTNEEKITHTFLLKEKYDLIINVIDATNIERGLYLTTQLFELNIPIVLVLNMYDSLKKKNVTLNVSELKKHLDVDCFTISASKKKDIDHLINYLVSYKHSKKSYIKMFSVEIENAIELISMNTGRYDAIKILEKDSSSLISKYDKLIKNLEKKFNNSLDIVIANERYAFIEQIKNKTQTCILMQKTITDKIDEIILNKFLAIPIYMFIMMIIYFVSIEIIGSLTTNLTTAFFSRIIFDSARYLQSINVSPWIISLFTDGIISGVGSILSFVPQIAVLFIWIAFLEATGYMARVALIFDRLFRYLNLSGNSLIPFMIGTSCSVPGIMATRSIKSNNERTRAIILTPFIPCSAKLPIIVIFTTAFFSNNTGLVAASIYFFSILLTIFSAFLMKKIYPSSKESAFIMELPKYKMPRIMSLACTAIEGTLEFINRAGTVILSSSIIIWFMISFSWRLEYGISIEHSILASIGNCFAWFLYPVIGTWSWEATVSTARGIITKEGVISTLSIISSVNNPLKNNILNLPTLNFLNQTNAYSFMFFNIFSIPCISTIATMRNELSSTKKTLCAVFYQTGLAWITSIFIFQLMNLLTYLLN